MPQVRLLAGGGLAVHRQPARKDRCEHPQFVWDKPTWRVQVREPESGLVSVDVA